MVYPHKWSPISYKSSAEQRKHTGQRPMFYLFIKFITQPTNVVLYLLLRCFEWRIRHYVRRSGYTEVVGCSSSVESEAKTCGIN